VVLRAVIAVMTLVGAVPFRVCTCGAAHIHHHAPPVPLPESPEPLAPALGVPNDSHPVHDHDCLAVKPRCAMSVAVPATPADEDVPAAFVAHLLEVAVLQPTADAPAPKPRSPDPPPDRPLFLTFLTLRN
jgi:hypothetical protein